ncbi:MAG: site-2 protease family protein [Sandaracinaceae bacterium]|jgi:tetratricopeptide (TPR) repeat protein|nr:site-2 protease family protein [Sandaracinaceae bacterium]MBK7778720.1 site-2 protease family protein [Sandaracinaceae bacterium]MBK8406666.1 site-2 protease family protein [Sandaracinaceae bacterium]MBK8589925.1 site-2 protease family protein [Sandaracinaceae bacterium]
MLHDPAPRRPLSPGELWGGIGLAALLFGLFTADTLVPFQPRKLAFPLVLLFWAPALVIHECGHALVARLVGWRVTQMVLGMGPELMRFHVGETQVVVRALLVEGYVTPAPKRPGSARLANALVYLGGPGAELLVAAGIALAWGWDPFFVRSDDYPLLASQSAALALMIGAVMNLVPHRMAGAPNDGLGILLSAGLEPHHFDYRLALPAEREVERALHAGQLSHAREVAEREATLHPENAHLGMLALRVVAAEGDTEGAITQLEALRETAPRNPLVEAELLHTAALIALGSGDPELLGRAVQAVRSAMEAGGAAPSYLATLGALLFEQGRMQEAFDALQLAYKGTRDPLLEDHCVAYLALVTRALGRTEDHTRFARELTRRGTHEHLRRRLVEG